MARIRTIKPEFWTDEKIVQLPFHVRLLFIGLWNFCDDRGCIKESPDRIRLQILPSDVSVDIEESLDLLSAAGLLDVLMDDHGDRAFRVVNWEKHQKIDNPSKARTCGDSYRKLAIPSESRRLLAKKYGCPPGGTKEAECYFCGSPGSIHWHRLNNGRPGSWVWFSGLEIDHIVPESKGGTAAADNLVLSCRTCNRGRCNKDHIDYLYRGLDIPSEPSPLEGKGREGKGKEGNTPPTPQGGDEDDQGKIPASWTIDPRHRFAMPTDWQPTEATLSGYIAGKIAAADGKPLTVDRVMEILPRWREEANASASVMTDAQWTLRLVRYAMAYKTAENKQQHDQQSETHSRPEAREPTPIQGPERTDEYRAQALEHLRKMREGIA